MVFFLNSLQEAILCELEASTVVSNCRLSSLRTVAHCATSFSLFVFILMVILLIFHISSLAHHFLREWCINEHFAYLSGFEFFLELGDHFGLRCLDDQNSFSSLSDFIHISKAKDNAFYLHKHNLLSCFVHCDRLMGVGKLGIRFDAS